MKPIRRQSTTRDCRQLASIPYKIYEKSSPQLVVLLDGFAVPSVQQFIALHRRCLGQQSQYGSAGSLVINKIATCYPMEKLKK